MKVLQKKEFAALCGCSLYELSLGFRDGVLGVALVGKRVDADHEEAVRFFDKYADRRARLVDIRAGSDYSRVLEFINVGNRVSCLADLRDHFDFEDGRFLRELFLCLQLDGVLSKGVVGSPRGNRGMRFGTALKLRNESEARADALRGGGVGGYSAEVDISAYADKRLKDLASEFGSAMQFGEWLKGLKLIEEIQGKRLMNAERLGELVSREMVDKFVCSVFENLFDRLLGRWKVFA